MRADLHYIEPTTEIAYCLKRFSPLVRYEALVEHDQASDVAALLTCMATQMLPIGLLTNQNLRQPGLSKKTNV